MESGVDFAWPLYGKSEGPAQSSSVYGSGGRRPIRRRRDCPRVFVFGFTAAGTSDCADSIVLARQSYVCCLNLDRLYGNAALSQDEGHCCSWQGLVDGGSIGKNGSFHPHYPFVALLSGP